MARAPAADSARSDFFICLDGQPSLEAARDVIARALGTLDLPPYAGLEEFCAALARFVKLPSSTLESRERLEQLRALEAGMRIDVDTFKGVVTLSGMPAWSRAGVVPRRATPLSVATPRG